MPRMKTDKRSGEILKCAEPEFGGRITLCPYFNDESSRIFDRGLRTQFFFLSPRRRSGERTEERGNPKTRLLSPALIRVSELCTSEGNHAPNWLRPSWCITPPPAILAAVNNRPRRSHGCSAHTPRGFRRDRRLRRQPLGQALREHRPTRARVSGRARPRGLRRCGPLAL